MSKFTRMLNALPVIRTLHKIYAIYATAKRLERDIQKLRLSPLALSALRSEDLGVISQGREQKIIISLTTYGVRIDSVHLAIESLMLQSVKADEIVLWLSADEFNYESIPEVLKLQEKRGLRIAFTEDTRSYKKLIPSLREYPDDLIITVDDDFSYPINHIERLYKAWLREPGFIHCYRAHAMCYDSQGELLPYSQWENQTHNTQASLSIFPTGGAGALYFPGCFDDDICNQARFTELCPTADDVWFKAMSLLRSVPCKVLPVPPLHACIEPLPDSGSNRLWDINKEKNDEQVRRVIDSYNIKLSQE
jgi:hypothetical protein